ncbi:MAG TPA: hypothetical protein VGC27_03805 [Rhizomicrobium sp.]
MQHMHMLPHIIMMGIPIFIMAFICSQHCFIISAVMPPIGVILQTMELPDISQLMSHAIIGIIIGIICGIIGMPPMFIIGIWGIMFMPPMFIIGIAGIITISWLRPDAVPLG